MWGFVMPRVAAKQDVHELYSPKSRSEAFPQADFRLVVHVATNVAKAFATLHQQGHIAGDVNHGNLLVGSDGTVTLIDCDSFQVTDGVDLFTCDVGVPLFTPPELQGKSLRGRLRTENHDLFGLAMLAFHLLYMGRHPYAGRYDGPGEMPIEKAMEEFRFAYGSNRRSHAMQRPPGTIPLETMGPEIAELFQRAFSRSGAAEGRPDAGAWIDALGRLASGLVVCPSANWHHHPSGLASCPWCEVEVETGARLFGPKVSVGTLDGAVDLATLLEKISAVPAPPPDPPLPSHERGRPKRQAKPGFARRAGGKLGAAVRGRASRSRRAAAEQAYRAARLQWEATLERWKAEATRELFKETLKGLQQAGAELATLPDERIRRLALLETNRETLQYQRYLDRFRIDRARITGIGPSRTAMLASFGIETAADVERKAILQIPGFNRMLATELVRWADRRRGGFRFNANAPVDRRDIELMDRELQTRRRELVSMLSPGPETLATLSLEIGAARQRLMPLLEASWSALKAAGARRTEA